VAPGPFGDIPVDPVAGGRSGWDRITGRGGVKSVFCTPSFYGGLECESSQDFMGSSGGRSDCLANQVRNFVVKSCPPPLAITMEALSPPSYGCEGSMG